MHLEVGEVSALYSQPRAVVIDLDAARLLAARVGDADFERDSRIELAADEPDATREIILDGAVAGADADHAVRPYPERDREEVEWLGVPARSAPQLARQ